MGLIFAFRAFLRMLFDAAFARRVADLDAATNSAPPRDDLRILGILQRDGRLVDFLLEDVSGYSDDQIGAAVRDIHRDCRKALEKYLAIEPILPQLEQESATVEAGFNPNEIRLSGVVRGSPPFRGAVVHRGWRVRESRLPAVSGADDSWLLAPAEVEVA